MSRKLFTILVWMGIPSLLVVMIFSFYLLVVDGNPPIEVSQPVQMSEGVVRTGETVYMTAEFCKNTDAPANLTTYWQRRDSGEIFDIRIRVLLLSRARCGKMSVPVEIPANIPPGFWKRVNIAEYNINFMRTRVVQWESEYIEVVR